MTKPEPLKSPEQDDLRRSHNKPIKVLHICETAVGGIASYLNLTCSMSENVQSSVLAPRNHTAGLQIPGNLLTFESTGRNLRSIAAFLRASVKVARQEKPDVIFFHSTFSLLALIALSILRLTPKTIYCAHGWAVSRYENPNKQRIVAFIEGRLCGLANRVVNISEYEKNLAESLGYRGSHMVIEHAVNERRSGELHPKVASDPACIDLLFVGRFDRQKGLDLLLDAFREVQTVRSDLRLHLIGATIRADQDDLELPPNTHSVGWVNPSELDDWYHSADALIVPSRWEGFGLVVPEALRNGTPVLCSNRGALPFLVIPEQTGQIFSLEDASLLALLKKLRKPELRAMRDACRTSYEERFAPSRFLADIRALYEELKED